MDCLDLILLLAPAYPSAILTTIAILKDRKEGRKV